MSPLRQERSGLAQRGGTPSAWTGPKVRPSDGRWRRQNGRMSDHGVGDRVHVLEADVRTAVPAAGAYVACTLLRCLHDGDAATVLRNCAIAGGPGAQV